MFSSFMRMRELPELYEITFSSWSIPERTFLCIRMISAVENHPGREFLCIRMHSAVENNPWQRISLNQDDFCCGKSSLSEDFFESG